MYLDNKSLWLPLKQEQVDVGMPNSGVTYEECGMYLDAHNHSLGKTECVHGYEFHFEGKEWNIVAEVTKRRHCASQKTKKTSLKCIVSIFCGGYYVH